MGCLPDMPFLPLQRRLIENHSYYQSVRAERYLSANVMSKGI